MSSHQVLPGLTAEGSSHNGYLIQHAAGSLMTGYQRFETLREARDAANVLALLGIDWTESIEDVREQVKELGTEYGQVIRWILLPAVDRERHRRISDNSVRYLRWLQAHGESVRETKSLGLAGTVYYITCGCARTYSVSLIGMEPQESIQRCEQHKGLEIPAESTDRDAIRRALREQRGVA